MGVQINPKNISCSQAKFYSRSQTKKSFQLLSRSTVNNLQNYDRTIFSHVIDTSLTLSRNVVHENLKPCQSALFQLFLSCVVSLSHWQVIVHCNTPPSTMATLSTIVFSVNMWLWRELTTRHLNKSAQRSMKSCRLFHMPPKATSPAGQHHVNLHF